MLDFADRLKEEINIRGFDFKTFGKIVNIPSNTLSEWCNERSQPYLDNLIKLADYFNCSTDYLVGKEDTKYDGALFKKCPPFSERLNFFIEKTNIKYIDLSTAIEVDRKQIYRWKNNKGYPQLFNIIKLAKYFDTTIDILIGRQ